MTSISDRVDDVAPLVLGRYQLEERLDRGGMGAVYRARDRASGEEVALKTLESLVPMAGELFEREYQTLSSIAHPSLARPLDYGVSDDDHRYFTMDLIEGEDLNRLAPLPRPEAPLSGLGRRGPSRASAGATAPGT